MTLERSCWQSVAIQSNAPIEVWLAMVGGRKASMDVIVVPPMGHGLERPLTKPAMIFAAF